MPAKVKADWELIEREWRSGQYTNVALAEKHNVAESTIRKRAAGDPKNGLKPWEKDLVEDYQKGVQDKLVRESANEGAIESATVALRDKQELREDREVLDRAIEVGVSVVRDHRKSLKRLRALADKMYAKVEEAFEKDSTAVLADWTKGGESPTDIILKLSKVDSEIIKNERTAFNLDAKEKDKAPITQVPNIIINGIDPDGPPPE